MYEHQGRGALDYSPCRYGNSRLLFRGPAQPLDGPYCAVLGGTETYGKFIETPFSDLVERCTGHRVVNLGCVTAGLDVFSSDAAVMRICENAQVTVVQTLGAHNMSNRYYTVHPRRNDRFLKASPEMQTMFERVDFTEFNFTRHMLARLREVAPEQFAIMSEELASGWVDRMKWIARRAGGRTVLLHLPRSAPDDPGQEPLLVDEAMIARVADCYSETVSVVPSRAALAEGTAGMVFQPLEELAAEELPGPAVHREVADALSPVIARLMG
ncbi:MAG: DUF6473 family protein [Paracoccaceae bacterium]